LPYKLLRYGGVPEPGGPVSVIGSIDGGGTTREGVGEVGGVVVLGASAPWGRPRGPVEILVIQWVNDACTRSVTTEIKWGSSSSSSPSASPIDLMIGNGHTIGLDDPMERRRGLRVPSGGTPAGRTTKICMFP
jgi:hypothetical protein